MSNTVTVKPASANKVVVQPTGQVQVVVQTGRTGPVGLGVAAATFAGNELILTMTDGSTINVGNAKDTNLDGGNASTVYLPAQNQDFGRASNG